MVHAVPDNVGRGVRKINLKLVPAVALSSVSEVELGEIFRLLISAGANR